MATDNVTVIRIIQYSGSEQAVRKALAQSLPLGIRQCQGYDITVAEHSSTLPPAIELPLIEVDNCLEGVKVIDHEDHLEEGPFFKALVEAGHLGVTKHSPLVPRSVGCCCPPVGHGGMWAAGPCPVHQGIRRGL